MIKRQNKDKKQSSNDIFVCKLYTSGLFLSFVASQRLLLMYMTSLSIDNVQP